MSLRLYNSLTKQKELFEPIEPGKVGIYLCGPTVYKDSHIGHAVGPVIFDALKKYLTYKGYNVKLIVNITDVDDKLIIESEKLGIPMNELAKRVSDSYFDAMDKLGVDSIDDYPRATDHIDGIITLVIRLIDRGAAYPAGGDVYFDITKCKDYGKLSHRSTEDQLECSRELAGSGKRHSADFALWKNAAANEIGWNSPWGRGRPGWHIECSAMSMALLGDTFDIHGGGMDLLFPHHENEIAQSETATGKPYVKYWLHHNLTRIRTKAAGGQWKTEKMSKSIGNIRTLKELFESYSPQGLRFFLLSTHYRRPIEFTDDAIEATLKGMMNIYRLLDRVARLTDQDVYQTEFNPRELENINDSSATEFIKRINQTQLHYLEALDDDFNTAGAIAELFELCNAVNRHIDQNKLETQPNTAGQFVVLQAARMITTLAQIIGLLAGPIETVGSGDELTEQLMQIFIQLRADARTDSNFQLADSIRDRLKEIGITLEDRPEGTLWQKE